MTKNNVDKLADRDMIADPLIKLLSKPDTGYCPASGVHFIIDYLEA